MIIEFRMVLSIPKGCHCFFVKLCHPFGIITDLASELESSHPFGIVLDNA